MKKYFSIVVLIIFTLEGYNQIFAPIGATWYYNNQEMVTFDAHGYIKYTVEKDTLIDSRTMRYITAKEFLYNGSEKVLDTIFVYVSDSQVFKLVNSELQLVFDFTLEESDTLKLRYNALNELCDSVSSIILDSIGSMVVDMDTLMVQHFSYYEKYYEESEPVKSNYKVIERIGTIGENEDFLKTEHFCSYESSQVNTLLRCYTDTAIHYMSDWVNEVNSEKECDYLINSVLAPSNTNTGHITVFPNPVKDNLYIVFDENDYRIVVYNALGQKILEQINSEVIDVSVFPVGMYFLQLSAKYRTLKTIKFFKE